MTLKVAIVGAGMMGRLHAAAWSAQQDVELWAVVDVRQAAAQALGDEYGVQPFTALADVLEGVDIISICTPPKAHREQVVAAAEAGAHILLEKPAGLTLADYDAMQVAVEAAGIQLMVGMTHRFYPEGLAAARWIAAGRIGEIVSMLDWMHLDPSELPAWYFDPGVAGGGVLLTNGIHSLDRILWLTGATSAQVYRATLRNLGRRGAVEDFAEVDLLLDTGAAAHVHLLWQPGASGETRLETVGSRAMLRVVPWQGITYFGPDGRHEEGFYTPEMDFWLVGIKAEVAAFLAAIRGESPLTSTLAENRRAFALIAEIYEQAGRIS